MASNEQSLMLQGVPRHEEKADEGNTMRIPFALAHPLSDKPQAGWILVIPEWE